MALGAHRTNLRVKGVRAATSAINESIKNCFILRMRRALAEVQIGVNFRNSLVSDTSTSIIILDLNQILNEVSIFLSQMKQQASRQSLLNEMERRLRVARDPEFSNIYTSTQLSQSDWYERRDKVNTLK